MICSVQLQHTIYYGHVSKYRQVELWEENPFKIMSVFVRNLFLVDFLVFPMVAESRFFDVLEHFLEANFQFSSNVCFSATKNVNDLLDLRKLQEFSYHMLCQLPRLLPSFMRS